MCYWFPAAPRPPPPPVPPEDSIVLNPSHFGIYIHPAGQPVLFAEEPMEDQSPKNGTQSDPPVSRPPSDMPPQTAQPPAPVAQAPHILPRPAPAGTVSFTDNATEPQVNDKSSSRADSPGSSLSPDAGDSNAQESPTAGGTRSDPSVSHVDPSSSVASEGEGRGSRTFGEVKTSAGDDKHSRGTSTAVDDSSDRQTGEGSRGENEDDIMIDDPIYGDEKMYNAAGELIAIGNKPVNGEPEGTEPSVDEVAGPMAPRPKLGPPLNALNGIVKIGSSHLGFSEASRDLRGSRRSYGRTLEIIEK